MATAFVLRYQESCDADVGDDVRAGTMTGTRTQTEQPDSDPRQAGYTAISQAALQVGTQTGTAVQTEQSDADRTSSCHGIPRTPIEMGTKSVTNVRAEASDDDPGRIQNQILPRCS